MHDVRQANAFGIDEHLSRICVDFDVDGKCDSMQRTKDESFHLVAQIDEHGKSIKIQNYYLHVVRVTVITFESCLE